MAKIHHWKMDLDGGLVKDYVGSANGTLLGSSTEDAGLWGVSRKFPGGDDSRINCGTPADLAFGSNPFTLSVWVKLVTPSKTCTILGRDNFAANDRAYWFAFSTAGTLYFAVSGNGSTVVNCSATPGLLDGRWHHIAGVKSGNSIFLYFDGARVAENNAAPSSIWATSQPFNIGSCWITDNSAPNGNMDNVEVWDEALSDESIAQIYYRTTEAEGGDAENTISLALDAGTSPQPDDTDVALNQNVKIHLSDSANTITLSSVVIKVSNPLGSLTTAYENGSFQNSFTGDDPAGDGADLYWEINPPSDWVDEQLVTVYIEALNDTGGTFTTGVPYEYTFTTEVDDTPPTWVTDSRSPVNGYLYADKNNNVSFGIEDPETGVNKSTIVVKLKRGDGSWETIYTGEAFQAGYTGSCTLRGDGKGYDFVVNPDTDFDSAQVIKVWVVCENNSTIPDEFDSETDAPYAFTVATYPYLSAQDPAPDTIAPVDKICSVKVNGGSGNVNDPSETTRIQIWLDGTLAYDDDGTPAGHQPGYQGAGSLVVPDGNDRTVLIDKEVNFPEDTVISFRTYAINSRSHTVDEEWNFTTFKEISISDQDPEPSETGVSTTATVYLATVKGTYDLDLTTHKIWVDGKLAYDNGQQAGFTVVQGGSAAKYTFAITADDPFLWEHQVPVRVVARDVEENEIDVSWHFTTLLDTYPIQIQNLDPYNGEIDVARDVEAEFELYDAETGVDAASLQMWVNDVKIYGNGAFIGDWSGSVTQVGSPNRYKVTYKPDDPYDDLYLVSTRVVVRDLAATPNWLDATYSFTTVAGPRLAETYPPNGAAGVSRDTYIMVNITGGEGDMLRDTIVLHVDAELAFVGGSSPEFKNGYTGSVEPDVSVSHNFIIRIQPNYLFHIGQEIVVTCEGENDIGQAL